MWDHQFSKKIGALGRAIYKQHLTHPTIQTAKLVDIVTKLGALTQTAGTAFMSRPHSLQMGNWNKKRADRTYFTEQNDAYVAAVNAMRARGIGDIPNTFMPSGLSIPGGAGPGGMFSYQGSLAQRLGESSRTELASQFAPLYMRSLTDAIENTPNDDMAIAISEKITDGIKKVGMESVAKQALINTFGLKRGLIPKTEWGAQLLLNVLSGIPHYADGGVVDRGTIALVGEAGPELILPLKDIPHFAKGGTVDGDRYTISRSYDFVKPVAGQAAAFKEGAPPGPIVAGDYSGITKDLVGNVKEQVERIKKEFPEANRNIAALRAAYPDLAQAQLEKLKYIQDYVSKLTITEDNVKDIEKLLIEDEKILDNLFGTVNAQGQATTSMLGEVKIIANSLQAMMDLNVDMGGVIEPPQTSNEIAASALGRIESELGKAVGSGGDIPYEALARRMVEEGLVKSYKAAMKELEKGVKGMLDVQKSRYERHKEQSNPHEIASAMKQLFGGALPRSFDPEDPKWEPMRIAASKRKAERAATPYEEPNLTGLTNLISNPSSELNGGPLKKSFKDIHKEMMRGLGKAMSGLFGGDISKAKGITGKLSTAMGNKASSLLGAGKLASGALLGGIALGVGSIVALLNKLVKASPVLQGVLDLFNLAVNMLLMPLGNAIGEKMLPAILEMITWAVDVGGPALAGLVDVGQNLWNWFGGEQITAIIDAVNFFKNGDWLGGLGKIWEAIMNGNPLLHALKDGIFWIKDKVLLPLWNWLSHPVENIFKPMGEAIKNVFTGIVDVGGNVVDSVKGFLGLASGGLVMGTPFGTPAIIGEGGQSELIVPLDEVQETFNGGKGITIVFQGPVYGMNDFKRTVTDIASEAINSARYR